MGRRKQTVVPRSLTTWAAIASVLAGLALATSVYVHVASLDRQWSASMAPPPPRMVWAAATDLAPGTVLTEAHLVQRHFAGWVPPTPLPPKPQLVGHTVQERILAGDILRPERLKDHIGGPGLNALIGAGHRAMSVNLTDADRVSGFVEPGDRVDLLVTLFDDGGAPIETTALLQGVPVLAIDDRTEADKVGETRIKPQVTLLLRPDDAQRLALSLQTGHPRLVLRSEMDG